MKLQPLMNMRAELAAPLDIGACPNGNRNVFNVTGGNFEGTRLRGKIVPGGGDWLLVDPNGVGRLDVRITLETDDGARIYVQYFGVVVMNDKIMTALQQAGSCEFGDAYFMTQPRFETGDARYAWLNKTVAVAEGRINSGAVEYRMFEAGHE